LLEKPHKEGGPLLLAFLALLKLVLSPHDDAEGLEVRLEVLSFLVD
jgi:hypothetical protein